MNLKVSWKEITGNGHFDAKIVCREALYVYEDGAEFGLYGIRDMNISRFIECYLYIKARRGLFLPDTEGYIRISEQLVNEFYNVVAAMNAKDMDGDEETVKMLYHDYASKETVNFLDVYFDVNLLNPSQVAKLGFLDNPMTRGVIEISLHEEGLFVESLVVHSIIIPTAGTRAVVIKQAELED